MDALKIPPDNIGSRLTTNILPSDFDHEREDSKTDGLVENYQDFNRVEKKNEGKKLPSIQKRFGT